MRTEIDNKLIRNSRPGYPSKSIGEEVVAKWVQAAKEKGAKSILCLLSDAQLQYYQFSGDGNLIDYYRAAGLEVASVPVEDHKWPPLSQDEMEQALAAYQTLPKPCLVHCSAGIDRTGAVVDAIVGRGT